MEKVVGQIVDDGRRRIIVVGVTEYLSDSHVRAPLQSWLRIQRISAAVPTCPVLGAQTIDLIEAAGSWVRLKLVMGHVCAFGVLGNVYCRKIGARTVATMHGPWLNERLNVKG